MILENECENECIRVSLLDGHDTPLSNTITSLAQFQAI